MHQGISCLAWLPRAQPCSPAPSSPAPGAFHKARGLLFLAEGEGLIPGLTGSRHGSLGDAGAGVGPRRPGRQPLPSLLPTKPLAWFAPEQPRCLARGDSWGPAPSPARRGSSPWAGLAQGLGGLLPTSWGRASALQRPLAALWSLPGSHAAGGAGRHTNPGSWVLPPAASKQLGWAALRLVLIPRGGWGPGKGITGLSLLLGPPHPPAFLGGPVLEQGLPGGADAFVSVHRGWGLGVTLECSPH